MSEQKKVFIDRDHFDERVRLAAGPDADEEFSADFLDGVKVVLHMLSTETPADVKPVVRGNWIEGEYVGDVGDEIKWHCSSCGFAVLSDEYPAWHFCPTCGVDMRGKEE